MTTPGRTYDESPELAARAERIEQFLGNLNGPQLEAVKHREGPLVVFAGAGSGKTRIITTRIAYLIETGVPPWQILAVTFTNKAAGEMQQRLRELTPYANRCHVATFHSACARWLREHGEVLGFTANFSIYDDDDSAAALKAVFVQLNIPKDGKFTIADYKSAISTIKTAGLFPDQGTQINDIYGRSLPPDTVQVYRKYQEYLAFHNAMDFADLLMNTLLLLRKDASVRENLQNRYRHILVDEYQDTNPTQFELIQILADPHKNLCVVGDDDQAIYSWRGATSANILQFDQIYPNARKIILDQNYRCSQNIVDAASSMIANNKVRAQKKLWTSNPIGDSIRFRYETDNETEAWWVIRSILEQTSAFSFSDIAIFYRTNSQSRALEEALVREKIPYQVFGAIRFYDRMEVKDLLAYLKLIENPADDIGLKRVINIPPRGVGAVAVQTLESEATRRGITMFQAMEEMEADHIQTPAGKLFKKLRPFAEFLSNLRQAAATLPLGRLVDFIVTELDYGEYLRKKFPDQYQDKLENIQELGGAMASFADLNPDANLSTWLQNVALSTSAETSGSGVTLMTLHMAKGLEYPCVYLVGVEENLLPHKSSLEDPADIEEERRLFYVGMTRAKHQLNLLCAHRRSTYATWVTNSPSRFLNDIPRKYLEIIGDYGAVGNHAKFSSQSEQPKPDYNAGPVYEYHEPYHDQNIVLNIGQQVTHPTFGRGVIEQVVEDFGKLKAIVNFGDVGRRKVSAHHLDHCL